jgi:L-aminopeptidase/D-esterase-like protein
VRAAHANDAAAATCCTVVVMPKSGDISGVDVRGSAPGTRETALLAPTAHVSVVHAFLSTGGSAYGLDVRSFQSPPEQLVAAAQASKVSRCNQLQRVDLECRVGEEPL